MQDERTIPTDRRGIHVAVVTCSDVERLWALTQDPTQHSRWDVRFARIEPTGPGAFVYRRFGVRGTGTHAGERRTADGGATSALTFACPNPLSPIVVGSGYWRYRPLLQEDGPAGTSFETGYDYRPRHAAVDRVFRPLMAWGTAWSFDRLRLWADHGVTPEVSAGLALLDGAGRLALVALAFLVGLAFGVVPGLAAALVVGALAWTAPPLPGRPSARRTTWSWRPATTRTQETVA